jgi:carboxypeptidase family protein
MLSGEIAERISIAAHRDQGGLDQMTRLFRAGRLPALALAIAVACLPPTAANAQQLYGSIVGTVTDTQGAATPGVTVVATNTGTALKVEAVTDTSGGYVLRNLLPGTYTLTANLTGFREHTEKGIPVQAGNPVRIDVKLEVGALTEVVEVVSETTLLKTEKADLGSQISAAAITNLPLNQFRNYQTLLNLVPGATPTQYQNAEIDTPGRSLRTWVNGTQPNANTTRVDEPSPSTSGCRITPCTSSRPSQSRRSISRPTTSTPTQVWQPVRRRQSSPSRARTK